MKAPIAIHAIGIVFVAATFSGCTSNATQFAPQPPNPTGMQTARHNAHPDNCSPAVWASTLRGSYVYGYTAPNSSPCVTLHGPYNGLTLNSPHAVAIGSNPDYLYVADMFNERVVVFDYSGNYVKWFSTKLGNIDYEPWGVCVSAQGEVAVGDLRASSQQGNVEFFSANAPSGSLPSGDANGQSERQTYCAFDSTGNFFVSDGTGSGVSTIDYLASAYVGLPGQTLSDSGLGTAVWTGMYSRIDDQQGQTLSVDSDANESRTQRVYTWSVSGPPTGPLTFAPVTGSPYLFHHYPHLEIPVNQVAPSTGSLTGTLYFAAYGQDTPQGRRGQIVQAPANGGSATLYQHLRNVIGVATNPSGQY
jgi:hypothetical protein